MSREPNLRVVIDHIGAQGDGVAFVDGAPLYVPFSVPGDELDVVVNGKIARITRIVAPGPGRALPPCRHFGACGGCILQHLKAADYAAWKRNLIAEALCHRGFQEVTIGDVIISPSRSRRRAVFHALSRGRDDVVIGFHEAASHRIVDLEECLVLVPEIVDVLPGLRGFLGGLLSAGQTAAVQLTQTDTGLDLVLDAARPLDLKTRMVIADFAAAYDLARVSWGADREVVAERRAPQVRFGGIAVAVPPGGFLQAAKAGEEALVKLATAAIQGAKQVADLFAGSGTFTFPLASFARVHAVEAESGSISALKSAADLATGLRQVTTERRDLFRRPLLAAELKPYSAVLFDPPRVGARDQAGELAKSAVPVVVGVSCNPATFARDARSLVDGGYQLETVTPVDQFLWSPHVELIAVFRKS